MQTVPPGQSLPEPNVCVLCEAAFSHESPEPVIDTLRDFEVAVITKLTGRKLICWACAKEIARLREFVDPDDVASLEAMCSELRDEVHRLVDKIASYQLIEAAYAALKDVFDPKPAPKARAKKEAPDVPQA